MASKVRVDRPTSPFIQSRKIYNLTFHGSGKGKKRAEAVNKERRISKMFVRGDSVIMVLKNLNQA